MVIRSDIYLLLLRPTRHQQSLRKREGEREGQRTEGLKLSAEEGEPPRDSCGGPRVGGGRGAIFHPRGLLRCNFFLCGEAARRRTPKRTTAKGILVSSNGSRGLLLPFLFSPVRWPPRYMAPDHCEPVAFACSPPFFFRSAFASPPPAPSSTVETGGEKEEGGKGGGSQGIVVIFYVGLLPPPPSSLFLPSNISSCLFFPLFLSHNKPARQPGREGEGTDDMTHCCHCEGHSRSLFLPPRPSCAPRRKSSPFPSLPIPPFFHDKFLLTTSAHWQE